jgi:hypothetical protein
MGNKGIRRTAIEHELKFKNKVTLMMKHKFNPYFAISEADSGLEESNILASFRAG